MAMTEVTDGQVNVAATDTEYTIGSAQTTDGTYVLVLDLNSMANGDIIVVRAYTKARSTSTSRLASQATYGHIQIEPNKYSTPLPVTNEITYKIEQTDGTAVGNLDYAILRV